jgi:hypothetical protein
MAHSGFCQVQSPKNVENESKLFVSFGAHIGYTLAKDQNSVPYNIQLDYNIHKNVVGGFAYAFDEYTRRYVPGLLTRPSTTRHNFRFRCYYLDGDGRFSVLGGGAAGISLFEIAGKQKTYRSIPTFQILTGFRFMVTEVIGFQFEISLGAPYFLQGSVGFHF